VFVNKVMNGSRKKEELLVGRRMLYKARVWTWLEFPQLTKNSNIIYLFSIEALIWEKNPIVVNYVCVGSWQKTIIVWQFSIPIQVSCIMVEIWK
jgi:hypothetical protein